MIWDGTTHEVRTDPARGLVVKRFRSAGRELPAGTVPNPVAFARQVREMLAGGPVPGRGGAVARAHATAGHGRSAKGEALSDSASPSRLPAAK